MKNATVAALLVLAACGDPYADVRCYPDDEGGQLYEVGSLSDHMTGEEPDFAACRDRFHSPADRELYIGPHGADDFSFDVDECMLTQVLLDEDGNPRRVVMAWAGRTPERLFAIIEWPDATCEVPLHRISR